MRWLRRVEQHCRRGRSNGARRHGQGCGIEGPQTCARRPGRRFGRIAAPAQRHCRIRPRAGRRAGARSAVLVGGDPGIGKSTLLLAVAARAATEGSAVYVSGEEAIDQIRMRAARMGVADAPVELATATSVRDIAASMDAADGPDLIVIDSIQTMYVDTLEAARARHGFPSPGVGPGVDPGGQEARHRPAARRPCHQGRRHRGPARARAHGRHGALFRRRAQPSVPHPALRQEPVRPDRRDRRVRDDRPGPCRGSEPVRPVPGRAGGERRAGERFGRARQHGRHAAFAGRSPGAGRAGDVFRARAARSSAGTRRACTWCWPCSRPGAGLRSPDATFIST